MAHVSNNVVELVRIKLTNLPRARRTLSQLSYNPKCSGVAAKTTMPEGLEDGREGWVRTSA
jgi:hypothetical protein